MPITTIGIVIVAEYWAAAPAIIAILSPLVNSVAMTTPSENKPPATSHMAPHSRRKIANITAGRVVNGPPKMIIQELSGSALRKTKNERTATMWCTIPSAIPAIKMLDNMRR